MINSLPLVGLDFFLQKLTLWFLAQSLDGKRQRKPFICSDCGEKFLGRIALEEHSCSRVHKGKKPGKCTVIEKLLGVHDGKKPEKCSVIEKPSGVHKEKNPEKCTEVEKPLHKCGKCEKTFEILSDLDSHGCQKNPFYDDSKDTKGKVNPGSS